MANGYWDAQIDLRRFHRNLRAVKPKMEAELRAEALKRSKSFAAHLKRNVNKKDGNLAATIRTEDRSAGDVIEQVVLIGNAQHDYASALEFGHASQGVHVPGQRYWLPLAKRYNRLFKNAGKRILKRAFKAFT